MLPRNADDLKRAEKRANKPLTFGRPVQNVTRTNGEKLLGQFQEWLSANGASLAHVLQNAYAEPEVLVRWLVQYGRQLYDSGRPYSHNSETVNAIGAAKPTARRLMTGAWDLAFTWLREEPATHHVACPYQILLALLNTSIMWGWPLTAGCIALCWGALCRAGEVLAAFRTDLVLPSDVGNRVGPVLLRIAQPKTRYRAARHQLAKMEWEDLVSLVCAAFGSLRPGEKLWPFSGQTLRNRVKQLVDALGIKASEAKRSLDLGSLRAGGATHLLGTTEDAELVRRRGRWIYIYIYIQEIQATTFFPHLPEKVKDRILKVALSFPGLLRKMCLFRQCKIPTESWHHLFCTDAYGGKDG